jgi:hypothetical protein
MQPLATSSLRRSRIVRDFDLHELAHFLSLPFDSSTFS